MATTKRRKKKKSPLRSPFYWILILIVLASLLGIRIGCGWLTDYLTEYEATRPQYAVDEALKIFENKDFDTIEKYNVTIREYSDEDKDGYTEYINDLVGDRDLTCKEVYSLDKNEMLFSIMAGEDKLGNFKMVHSGEVSEHGYPYWEMGDITLIDIPQSEFFITVPSDSTVSVDGRTLGEEDVIEKDILDKRGEGFVPKDSVTYTYTKYHVITRFGTPEFEVTDKYGNRQQPEAVNEVEFKCDLAYNENMQKSYSKNVLKIAENIAKYSTADISIYGALTNVMSSSPAGKMIENMDTRWAVPHSGYRFQNETCDQFLQYSDSVFSCVVKFDYVLKTSVGNKVYPTTYTMYFKNNGSGYKLYNLSMHE